MTYLFFHEKTYQNFDNLDQLHQDQGRTPVLLFHGTGDETTPISISETFARKHADSVTFHPVSGAGHVLWWNTNLPLYEAQVSDFLTSTLHLQKDMQRLDDNSLHTPERA